jgi:hypothetical protein
MVRSTIEGESENLGAQLWQTGGGKDVAREARRLRRHVLTSS